MLYTESKEKSAELLRAVLALMNQHSAAFNPVTYAVCYEYVAGINGRLNQAFDHFTRTEARRGDNTMVRLYREHIADIDDISLDIHGQLLQVLDDAHAQTEEDTSDDEDDSTAGPIAVAVDVNEAPSEAGASA